MKRNEQYYHGANAGGGTVQVPFYGVIAPTAYVSEIIATALTAAVKYAFEAIRRGYWERKTKTALTGLDDAILRDIGVTRSQIAVVARTAAESPTYDPARRFPWAA